MEETNNESIEKKLAYLNETKGLIKSAIINKGQELTDETPFRDYVQKIDDIETGVDTSDATALASDLLKGKTAYNAEGKIVGTLELKDGDVKLFETKAEMQSDPNAQEGDLAVIYRSEIQNATVDSRFQTATFPDTVVLDSAITDYVDIRYRAVDDSVMFDCWGSLDSSMFMMDCYSESGEVRIQYESSDGITYTRTDTMGNPIDFGTEIYYERTEYWNDAIGKFIQIGGSTFEGLYEYIKSKWVLASTQLTLTKPYELLPSKVAFGKNGVITGDNSFYDNLDLVDVITNKTHTSKYEEGLYVVSADDLTDKGLMKSTYTDVDYYTNAVCLQQTKTNSDFIDNQSKIFTTATTIIKQTYVSNTSYTFSIYNRDLENIMIFTIPVTKTWTINYRGQQIVESPDHTQLRIIVQTSNTDVGVIIVDLINKTYTMETVNNVHMYYSNLSVTIDLNHDEFYWTGMFYDSATTKHYVRLYKNTEVLSEQSLDEYNNFDSTGSPALPICTKIGDYIYFGRLGYKEYKEYTDNILYVYHIDTAATTSLVFSSSAGYLLRGENITENGVEEVGYIQTSESPALKIQKITPTTVTDLTTNISTYKNFSIAAQNRVYSNGNITVIIDIHGYVYNINTNTTSCIFSVNNKDYQDIFDFNSNFDIENFVFNSYDRDVYYAYGINRATGQLFLYELHHNLMLGVTDKNFLIRTKSNSNRYLAVVNDMTLFVDNITGDILSPTEYQTALDTAYSIRDDQVE